MNKRYHFILLVVCNLIVFPGLQSVHAQDTNRAHGRGIESFPYPFARMYYIQPHYDRTNNDDGSYMNTYNLRAFTTVWGNMHFRMDIPLAETNVAGDHIFGLSDITLRAVHAQKLHDKLFLGYGGQLVMNTATNSALGGGKWDIRPGVGLIYFRGSKEDINGTNLLSLEYRTSLVTTSGRARTNVLALSPNIDWWFKRLYVGYYATWTYDFTNDIFDIPIDVEVGYSITSYLVLAGEFVLPLLKETPYRNEFAIKLRYSFH